MALGFPDTVVGRNSEAYCADRLAEYGSLFRLTYSLPLDRPRRLAGHVIHHAVDALDFVDDARRGRAEERHVERVKVRGHAVSRRHRAQAHDVFVRATVAH